MKMRKIGTPITRLAVVVKTNINVSRGKKVRTKQTVLVGDQKDKTNKKKHTERKKKGVKRNVTRK